MATITTTTNTTPFVYPSNTLLDRNHLTGYLYVMVRASTANTYTLYRSTDNGTSWVAWLSITRANVQELGSIFVTNDSWVYWAYRTSDGSADNICFQRADLTLAVPVWEGENVLASAANGGVPGAVYRGVDIMVVVHFGFGVRVVVAAGALVGGARGVELHGATITSIGYTVPQNSQFAGGVRSWFHGSGLTAAQTTPSMDLAHSGDGKASGSPHLWITYGREALRIVAMGWNGNGWISTPDSYITLASTITSADSVSGRFDGSRYISVARNPSQSDTVKVYERNAANTATTTRTTPAHPAGNIRQCNLSYNDNNKDLRVYAVGTSSTVLYYVNYLRDSATWGSWTTVDATGVLGTTGDNWGLRRGTYGDAKFRTYMARTSASPFTLIEVSQAWSVSPNTPTWVSPSTGQAQDTAATLLLDWAFSDPDPTATQGSYALRRQIGAGAFSYWRASDSTWQASEQQNTSGTTQVTLSASWGAGTDANHSYAVKTWDNDGLASGYSSSMVVIPSVKVNPTLTSPAAAAVLTASSVTVSWTVSEQTAYQIKLKTNPGGVTMYDSGKVTSTSTSVVPAYVLPDNSGWTVELTTWNNEGLASTTQTRNFTVDFIEPMLPTIAPLPQPALGILRVAITNPTPSGGAPSLLSQDLYRRVVGTSTDGTRIATGLASGASHNDWSAVSKVAYEYRVVAFGTNGTVRYSAWTS